MTTDDLNSLVALQYPTVVINSVGNM